MTQYQNYYECPCGTKWSDEWDCMCDDRCPVCNTSCSPSDSAEIDDDPRSDQCSPIPSYYIKAAKYLADTMGPTIDPIQDEQREAIKDLLQGTYSPFSIVNEVNNSSPKIKNQKAEDSQGLSFIPDGPTPSSDFLKDTDETEAECKARMLSIAESYKTKRYSAQPTMVKRTEEDGMATLFRDAISKISMSMRDHSMVWYDEAQYINPSDYYLGYKEYKRQAIPREPTEKDWERKTFKSGSSTPPSKAKRTNLRAIRKAKNK